jgi:hypothetical protein
MPAKQSQPWMQKQQGRSGRQLMLCHGAVRVQSTQRLLIGTKQLTYALVLDFRRDDTM